MRLRVRGMFTEEKRIPKKGDRRSPRKESLLHPEKHSIGTFPQIIDDISSKLLSVAM